MSRKMSTDLDWKLINLIKNMHVYFVAVVVAVAAFVAIQLVVVSAIDCCKFIIRY